MERWSRRVSFALFSLLLIGRVWLFEVVSVANDSMSPALLSGELLWVWRGPLASVEPGSVVLYEHSGVRSLKRVVAQPGQTVEVSAGALFVNGDAARQEDAVISLYDDCSVSASAGVIERWGDVKAAVRPAGEAFSEQVPPGHVYILGDHRAESSDSRQWGPLPEAAIRGVAGRVLWSGGGCDSVRWFRIGRRVR
ncbi:MAG: signal peptidase I [Myxococcota bacterium]|nr:signal peptidase I [Myxococcota bacterium]